MNIDKLPKWAQKHIRDLERERDNAVRDRDLIANSQVKGPVGSRRDHLAWRYIDNVEYGIRFALDNDDVAEAREWIDVRLRDGWVEVMASTRIEQQHQASNVFYLRSVR